MTRNLTVRKSTEERQRDDLALSEWQLLELGAERLGLVTVERIFLDVTRVGQRLLETIDIDLLAIGRTVATSHVDRPVPDDS